MKLSSRSFAIGIALAALGSVLFSTKAIVVKLAYRYGVDTATLMALRMLLSVPFFAAALLWTSRGAPRLSGSDHARLLLVGLLGYYAASWLDFLGLQYVSAALERLILYLTPTLVLFFSVVFLSKRVSRSDAIALALSYGGIVLVFAHDVSFDGGVVAWGSFLVFGSAISYAAYLVISGEMVKRIGPVRLVAYAMCVATVAVVLQWAALNPPESLLQPAPVWWLSVVNAVLCTVVPVFATMLAVARIGAATTSLAAMIGPISTIGLAWFFLDEPVTLWQLSGTVLVLAGVAVLTRMGLSASAPSRS
ncbi:MAG: DMT family transporter [Burkholderiaceae bacterium]